ncbi:MAG TPA: TolC family protein [Candidatus Omnitrophota bacterium]|nr:TolC family protein [Candidatus Omnitrophota bacterium]HPD84391.1 TolC family protein [Candidatus Omnitrophota bacterium]HRZ03249.1 TolC family protein [Candidatus Omnitrophota bacterium]
MKFYRFIAVIVFAVAAIAYPSFAQDKAEILSLGLGDVLKMAVQRDARIIMAEERVAQSVARLGQSRSVFLPQLTASASQKRQTSDLRSVGISLGGNPKIGPYNSFDARIKLTQTIFDAAAIKRLQAAGENRQLSLAEQRKTREDVLALVAVLFIDAQRAEERVEPLKLCLKRDEKLLSIAEKRFSLGTASALELKQAKADYFLSRHNLTAAHREQNERKLDLLAALGIPFEQSVVLVKAESLPEIFLPPEEKDFDVSRHPDVEVAQKQLDQNKKISSAERADFLPKISGIADYGSNGENPDNSSNVYMLGVQATLPIFEGGNRISRIREADSRVKENQANVESVKRYARAGTIVTREKIEEARALVEQRQAEWEVLRQALDVAANRFQSGLGSETDVIEAETDLALAADQRDEALAFYLTAQINRVHALGQISVLSEQFRK